jgi:hypothetical protein
LESGIAPESYWPTQSEGSQALLHSNEAPAAPSSCVAAAIACASAIRVHRTEKALLAAARVVVCHFGWLLDPSLAVVVVANPPEQQRFQSLISRWWKNEFIPPDKDPNAAPSVVLVEEIGGRQWQEVVVGPDCLNLAGVDLAKVVAAATLGLHTLPLPR